MNIKKLLELSKKPEIFTRSDQKFWDDRHISKQMLNAHLDPDCDAASRSFETISSSVNWLVEEILPDPAHGTGVLDLGCGPGLYAAELARAGYRVTGIDYSRRSIDYAREEAAAELLDSHGFKDHEFYSDLTGRSYSNQSETIALVTRK